MRAALLAVALVGLPALAGPPGASALSLRTCKSDATFVCGSVRVPLDRGARVPGSLRIAVAAQRDYPKGAGLLVALSGGPGQSTVDLAGSYALSLEPLLSRYRVVVLDQRGTGLSGALSCPKLQGGDPLGEFTPQSVAACAKTIGPRRSFYRTSDSVADIDAIRRAFGAKKVALMGISYGTWVAQEYARTYPRRTDSLVLDSVVGPTAGDGFGRGNFQRLPRVLRELCARKRCRGATGDIVGDLGKVAARVRSSPLRGVAYDASGRARRVTYATEPELYFAVTSSDINPFMQARLPSALGSAARGDLAPLLRLRRIAAGAPSTTRELSFGLNVATGCQDSDLPFALSSEPGSRLPLIRSALAKISPATYAPWSTDLVAQVGIADDCRLWPRDDRPKPVLGPLPDVRALLLAGRLDMRTPLEDAQTVSRSLPRAELVTVPGNGHDQVDTDATGCVERALQRWAARKPVGRPCTGRSNQVPPLARPPLGLADFRSPARIPGDRGRTLLAVLDTVEDARFSALEALFAGFKPRGGGLRGGSFSATDPFEGTLTLRDYAYVPGVRVSGNVQVEGQRVSGRVTVRGRIGGTLDLRSTTAATGTLGGRRVAYARSAAAGSARAGDRRSAFPQIPADLLDPAAAARRVAAR